MSYEKHYGIHDPVSGRWYHRAYDELWRTTSEAVAHAQLDIVRTFPILGIHKANPPQWQVVCIEKWHREREEERLRKEQEIAQVKLEEQDGSTS